MADVKLIIAAEDKASGVIKNVASEGQSAFRGMEQSGRSAFDGLGASWKKLVGAFAAYKLGDLFAGLAKDTIKTAASFEQTEVMLKRLMGSAAAGREAFSWLLDFSTKTPFGIDALKDSFVKLQVAGLDPMSGKLQTLTDAVAAFGGSSQELQRASVAIQQMASKGVISMEELRGQLGESLPTAMKVMARELGISMSQLGKVVEDGALDAKTGLDALFKGLKKDYAGAGEEMMNTWAGLMSMLSTEFKKAENELAQGGLFDMLKDGVLGLTKALQEASADGSIRMFGEDLRRLGEIAIEVGKFVGGAFEFIVQGLGRAIHGPAWEVMEEERKKLKADFAWIAENRKFLQERSKKYSDKKETDAAGALQAQNAAKEVEKLNKEWEKVARTIEMDLVKGGLNEFEKKVVDISAKAGQWVYQFQGDAQKIVEIKQWEASQLEQIENESYAKQLKNLQDYIEKGLNEEKKAVEENLKGYEKWRDALVKAYDDAIKKADEYGAKAQEIFKEVEKNQKFLATFGQGKKTAAEQLQADQRALEDLLKTAKQSMEPTALLEAASGIRDFLIKYQEMKNSLGGSEVFISRWKNELQDLNNRLIVAGQSFKNEQSAILEFAQTQLTALAEVDKKMLELQNRVVELDKQLEEVHSINLDTSGAVSALDALGEYAERLFAWIAGSSSQAASQLSGPPAQTGGGNSRFRNDPFFETGPIDFDIPQMATGTPYVPKTGLYMLHQGEAVITAAQNKPGAGGGKAVNNNITLNVHGVNDPVSLTRMVEKRLRQMGAYR